MQDQNPEPDNSQTTVTEPDTPQESAMTTGDANAPMTEPPPARKGRRRAKTKSSLKPAAPRKAVSRKPKKGAKAVHPEAASKVAKRKGVSRFVVLFRHGLAEVHAVAKPDGDRSLTAEGHAKTKSAARGMEALFPEADTIFSSPLLRAMQTALWLTKAYKDKLKIQVTDTLLPSADPERLAELIASQDGRNIIVVGHEPHLTDSFATFVGVSSSLRADLKKAGCIGIRLDESGRGTLEWMLAPRMLRRLG